MDKKPETQEYTDLTLFTDEEEKRLISLASRLDPKMWDLLSTFDDFSLTSKNLHCSWQMLKAFVNAISTQDPESIHYKAARSALEDNCLNLAENTQIIDQLARKLIRHCAVLKIKLTTPKKFEELLLEVNKIPAKKEIGGELSAGRVGPIIEIFTSPKKFENFELCFEKDSMFLGDYLFLKVIKVIGKTGENLSKELKPVFQDNFISFKKNGTDLLDHWFNTKWPKKPISKILNLLAKIILEDEINKSINFGNKNVAALTSKIHTPVIQITSPKIKFKQEDKEEIQLYISNNLLASIKLPFINSQVIKYIKKGTSALSCLTTHRFLRHCIETPFFQFASGIKDYRIMRYEGGYKELANEIGLPSKKDTTKLKHISYALNYLEFEMEEITSRLLNISQFKSKKSNRNDGLEITVLSPLLPYRIFEDKGLLIPLLKEPPLIGRPNDWAKQLLLQWMIAEIFTQKSIDLAIHDCIEISNEKWNQLADSCEISKNLLQKIKASWTKDEAKGKKFLEEKGNNFYTLGDRHEKELSFLREQGFRRLKQRRRGKASAKKRSMKNT